MLRKIIILLLCIVSNTTLAAPPTTAATVKVHVPPQALVEKVTADLLQVLRNDKDKIAKNPTYLTAKVEELIFPAVDFFAMSKFILGQHWKKATAAQQQAFVIEFRQLLVRTYQHVLKEFDNEYIVFEPFIAGQQPTKLAIVRSQIKRANGPSIPLVYNLRYTIEDGWKVYDIGVEGMSLVTNYRASFNREISQKGIDKLIEQLKERNKAPAAPEKAR
ncbi:MAG: ABC transporter substrate-binding protein [Gammaproteobacteria bacterium]|nr:ABC transporter substrate-binding protein [Gammaproteobacteria bacterium]